MSSTYHGPISDTESSSFNTCTDFLEIFLNKGSNLEDSELLLLQTEISRIFLRWDHAVSPKLSTHDLASTKFCRQLHYDVTYTIMTSREVDANMARRGWKSTYFFGFFIVDFIHFASRRKIINHHVAGGTRESHRSVQDLKHLRLSKPRRGLQILDTQMGFPSPSQSMVIDSINLLQYM